ncbi:hypothetical protein CHISP_2566 [Chitinispirillum alkaliphilum]|nr:hypothetical protein CHISP_2566 [Chitinispirillum alkaliphilum]
MKPAAFFYLSLVALTLLAACAQDKPTPKSNTMDNPYDKDNPVSKRNTMHNPYDNVSYSVRYANNQRNSFANAKLASNGILKWERTYTDDYRIRSTIPGPVSLYAANDVVGVQVNPILYLYRGSEFITAHYPIVNYTRDVCAFFSDRYTFFSYGPIKYWSYSDGTQFDRVIPDVGLARFWVPLLLLPVDDGLVFAQWFMGGPSRRPQSFMMYHSLPEEVFPEWAIGEDDGVNIILASSDSKMVIYVVKGTIHTVDIENKVERVGKFAPDLTSIISASLDFDDNLILHGTRQEVEVITAYSIHTQEKLWEYSVIGSVKNLQPPVIGEDNSVFFVTDSILYCIKNGEHDWALQIHPVSNPLMTIGRGNDILLQSDSHIWAFTGRGEEIFRTRITDDPESEFTAPPVIGTDGLVYVSCRNRLYCFE